MVRGFRVRRSSEPTPGSASGRAWNHTETFEVPHLRQNDGRILRRAVPSWWDGSGYALVDWGVGRTLVKQQAVLNLAGAA